MLRLAEKAKLELHTLPQGEMVFALEAQGRGESDVRSRTGTGTFVDPRVGRGTAVTPGAVSQFARADGDDIVYSLPRVSVAPSASHGSAAISASRSSDAGPVPACPHALSRTEEVYAR